MTFGGGSQQYKNTVYRITRQAKQSKFFDEVIGYTDDDLKTTFYDDFWKHHGKFIESNPRGYGYWIWKSYLILKTLENMEDNDILIYADSGCEVNYKCDTTKIHEVFEYIKQNGIYQHYIHHQHLEQEWTKKSVFDALEMDINTYGNTKQIESCPFGCVNNQFNRDFVKLWFNTCIENNYINVIDKKICENHNDFKDHRHDQSIKSLLSKKLNLPVADCGLFFHHPDESGLTGVRKDSPIVIQRNKGSKTRINCP